MVNRVRKINPDGTKVCAKCRETKQPSEFHKKPGGCGLSPYCAKCKVAGNKERAKGFTWAATEKDRARFAAKFTVNEKGCHVWHSSLGRHGYGLFYLNGRQLSAHRIAWFLADKGVPPPWPGVLDHLCKNTGCVNADHLRSVTQKINSTENSNSPYAKNAAMTHCQTCGNPYAGANLALVPYRHQKSGKPCVTRCCLTCYPDKWHHAVIKRGPAPGVKARKPWRGPPAGV